MSVKSHEGCREDCTATRHEPDCPVAHPGVGVLIARRADALARFNKAVAQINRLREALTQIAEMRAEEGCDLGCVEKTREVAEEALR
jgi:hypothetical protein